MYIYIYVYIYIYIYVYIYIYIYMCVCLFVCFGPAFVPRGQLPREDLWRASLTPRPPVSPLVPCPPILLSCILHQVCTLPFFPVLYIYPNQVSGLPLPCRPVVHKYEPLNSSNPTYNMC